MPVLTSPPSAARAQLWVKPSREPPAHSRAEGCRNSRFLISVVPSK